MEADPIPLDHPERWNLIDGVLGEGSPFHETFGRYADGVELTTAVLPRGRKARLVPICNENTLGIAGLCREIHDLLVSKDVAGRDKAMKFCALVRKAGRVDASLLLQRLKETPLAPDLREIVEARIRRDA